MRRLLILVCTLVLVDTMLYAALVPLVPRFAHELHLSSAGAGVLVAAYAAGALIGGLPGGLAAVRLGPRRTVLCGLAGMGVASVAFAFADSYGTLILARLVQGAGSAFTWAGAFAWLLARSPRERRGEMIGTAMGAAVVGALLGPVVGAGAAALGRSAVFSAVAALAVVLAALTMRIASVPCEQASLASLAAAFGERRFLAGLGLLGLASLLFGIIDVLAPLHLGAAGWGATAIGAVWLVGAAIEAVQSPFIGRIIDRRGALVPVRYALGGAAAGSLLLAFGVSPGMYALFVIVASLLYGALFTPSFAMIADGADAAGLAQGMAFGFMNAAWALGAMVGPAAGGALASATGESLPFVLAAAVCAATLAATLAAVGRRQGSIAAARGGELGRLG
jgi:MFS family permease